MPVKRVYLEVYIIDKYSKWRLFVSPGLHIRDQSLDMLGLNTGDFKLFFDVFTSSPYVDPSFDLFGVSSQSLALSFSDFYQLPNALRVAVLERTDFYDLHLFFFDQDELVVDETRD